MAYEANKRPDEIRRYKTNKKDGLSVPVSFSIQKAHLLCLTGSDMCVHVNVCMYVCGYNVYIYVRRRYMGKEMSVVR